MRIAAKLVTDSFKPSLILPWITIGIVAYFCLPWLALEYGLTDATLDEFIDALAWKKNGWILCQCLMVGMR